MKASNSCGLEWRTSDQQAFEKFVPKRHNIGAIYFILAKSFKGIFAQMSAGFFKTPFGFFISNVRANAVLTKSGTRNRRHLQPVSF
ncbi:hypothetical protein ACIU1J_14620 [Azospirillum doebereinerae]|uniref:hypothetical protein n=1 Tax=Azospirillum doebereinerae TaxID=92933 RepID=UPI001EE510BD|nr:hypothetical protein [Azospirillum doebereinerae]MCG5239843.1 hypothetical protein [Azospirillum doebereinerae]